MGVRLFRASRRCHRRFARFKGRQVRRTRATWGFGGGTVELPPQRVPSRPATRTVSDWRPGRHRSNVSTVRTFESFAATSRGERVWARVSNRRGGCGGLSGRAAGRSDAVRMRRTRHSLSTETVFIWSGRVRRRKSRTRRPPRALALKGGGRAAQMADIFCARCITRQPSDVGYGRLMSTETRTS